MPASAAAGTPVVTIDGPRAIESIQVGDRVLTQDTSTGVLGFEPVLAIHHTKSAATVRVALNSESLVSTGIHRFWKAGLLYVNRDDPAIIVGARFGAGWTLNLGNPAARLIIAGIVAMWALLAVIGVAAGI